jgi:uncharacterized membrane protein YtjA (UPF0391 family)
MGDSRYSEGSETRPNLCRNVKTGRDAERAAQVLRGGRRLLERGPRYGPPGNLEFSDSPESALSRNVNPSEQLPVFLDGFRYPAWVAKHPFLKGESMLRLAIIFLVIALLAALFGFGLVADYSFVAAKILFFVFIVLAVLSFLGGVVRRPL